MWCGRQAKDALVFQASFTQILINLLQPAIRIPTVE